MLTCPNNEVCFGKQEKTTQKRQEKTRKKEEKKTESKEESATPWCQTQTVRKKKTNGANCVKEIWH